MKQSYDEIQADLNLVLTSRASVPRVKGEDIFPLDRMLSAALPALCRRACELACRMWPTENVSADILCCHQNDVADDTLYVHVYESFPSYGLDRIILARNGFWTLHTRKIAYADPDCPVNNQDVVAEALLAGRSLQRSVRPESNVPSERSVVAVNAVIPDTLKKHERLKEIRPGELVSMSIVFYEKDQPGDIIETINRLRQVEDYLNMLHKLSLFQSLSQEQRRMGLRKLLDAIRVGQLVRVTLQEAVDYVIRSLQ